MMSAKENLDHIQERIDQAARRAGRRAQDVTLLAVTKKVSLEKVLPYLQAGVHEVGENRVQEAIEKYYVERKTWNKNVKWHLIGPLQTNKAKKAVEFFDMIQSLDRWDLARDLDRYAKASGKTLECLVQVKISDEETKSGLDPSTLPDFLSRVGALSNLQVRGLMGIPPLTAQGDLARPFFRRLRQLFEDAPHVPRSTFNVLSMGMSSDFEVAVEEGSTMVRIGTALFGARA